MDTRFSSTDIVVRRDGSVERVPRVPFPALVVKSMLKPLQIVLAGLLVAAMVLISLPFSVALIIYGLMLTASIIELNQQRYRPGSMRVRELLMKLPPTLRTRIQNILGLSDLVRKDMLALASEPAGVREGLDQLVVTLIEAARRIDEIDNYLKTVDRDGVERQREYARQRLAEKAQQSGNPENSATVSRTTDAFDEQLAVIDRMLAKRQDLYDKIEEIQASLGAMHARVVQARVESSSPLVVEDELASLRTKTRALAESFAEVQEIV
jgi:uncharacterized coiled-coil DUF342 family protein